jgi:mannose-1-phosphate guanylyltransferase
MPKDVFAVVMAGGRGTRFWPQSRRRTPKQVLKIVGKKPLIEQTVGRLRGIFPDTNIFVITGRGLKTKIAEHLPYLARSQTVAEPCGRNSAPCVGLGAILAQRRHGGDPVVANFPVDAYVGDDREYRRVIRFALDIARSSDLLVTIGIAPTSPHTGYGYIRRGTRPIESRGGLDCYKVARFLEKPNEKRALQFVRDGSYFWNCGIFVWRASVMLDAFKEFQPRLYRDLLEIKRRLNRQSLHRAISEVYPRMPKVQVDRGILEHARNVAVVPAAFPWSDIGSWDERHKLVETDNDDNVFEAKRVLTIDARGNFVSAPGKLVAMVGVDNLVVVETDDAILICKRDRSQDVAKVVKQLEEENAKRYL